MSQELQVIGSNLPFFFFFFFLQQVRRFHIVHFLQGHLTAPVIQPSLPGTAAFMDGSNSCAWNYHIKKPHAGSIRVFKKIIMLNTPISPTTEPYPSILCVHICFFLFSYRSRAKFWGYMSLQTPTPQTETVCFL